MSSQEQKYSLILLLRYRLFSSFIRMLMFKRLPGFLMNLCGVTMTCSYYLAHSPMEVRKHSVWFAAVTLTCNRYGESFSDIYIFILDNGG